VPLSTPCTPLPLHPALLTSSAPPPPSNQNLPAGYNINNFDLPYLWERAKALKVDHEAHQWGRIRHRCVCVCVCVGGCPFIRL
jgi:hypothetical protein